MLEWGNERADRLASTAPVTETVTMSRIEIFKKLYKHASRRYKCNRIISDKSENYVVLVREEFERTNQMNV